MSDNGNDAESPARSSALRDQVWPHRVRTSTPTPMENLGAGVAMEHEAEIAIGEMNLAALTRLTERGLGAYKGPLVLTGQDVLNQRAMLYNGEGKRMLFGRLSGRRLRKTHKWNG